MNFDFLEDMDNEDEEIEIQYHPQNPEDAMKLKQFIEYQIQTLEVIDNHHQIKKIRIAMIYSIEHKEEKTTLYGKDENYELSESWDIVSKIFHHIYFIDINKQIFINRYHIKDIYQDSIVLDNGNVLYVYNVIKSRNDYFSTLFKNLDIEMFV